MFNNIPYELQNCNQWVVWKYETHNDKPTKVPYCVRGGLASVTDPNTWCSFKEACETSVFYDGIGFVLTRNDPYTVIDLDHTDDPDMIKQQQEIFAQFKDTYSELSPSGLGLHIILKGQLLNGRRKGKVEIYPHERFITMTGNVYNRKPIVDYQNEVTNLYESLGIRAKPVEIISLEQTKTDAQIFDIARYAENGDKFLDLFEGRWRVHYGSQSEADYALINIISYYSRNVEQIKRIFMHSQLALRDKAKRVDYVDKMIRQSFDNLLPPIDIGGLAENTKFLIEQAKQSNPIPSKGLNIKLKTVGELYPNEIQEVPRVVGEIKTDHLTYSEYALNVDFEELPDGFIKEIARYVYAQSPRPVKKIAMMSALALMSGICGRAYNISGTGVNNYWVLLGATGIGKEAMQKGIEKLIQEIAPLQPQAHKFLGISELVSGISLLRYLSEESNSFLTIQGEFGLTMARMTSFNAPQPMVQLRKVILDLYNKSGQSNIMQSTVYADKAKNIDSINAPAFSLLGESTPSRFYEALSDGLVEEGLISRLNIVETSPIRPPYNKNHSKVMIPESLKEYLLALVTNALTLNNTDQVINIDIEPEAEALFDDFDIFCTNQINSCLDETYRQLWNRGHLKALKLAGLFAISENMYSPVITVKSANLAIKFVNESTKLILDKYEKKEIGIESVGENRQLIDLCSVVKSIVTSQCKFPNANMQRDLVIPHSFIVNRCRGYKSFKQGKISPSVLINNGLKLLCDNGIITEVRPSIMREQYQFSGKAYVVTNASYILNEEYSNA